MSDGGRQYLVSFIAMDCEKIAEDSTRSLSATPLNLRFNSRMDPCIKAGSRTMEKCNFSSFSSAPDVEESIPVSPEFCRNEMARNNLEKQLMQATLLDKELSEIYLQRAIQRQSHIRTRIYERKKCGSWSSLTFLLLGIVPASLFIFALACTVYHINMESPQ